MPVLDPDVRMKAIYPAFEREFPRLCAMLYVLGADRIEAKRCVTGAFGTLAVLEGIENPQQMLRDDSILRYLLSLERSKPFTHDLSESPYAGEFIELVIGLLRSQSKSAAAEHNEVGRSLIAMLMGLEHTNGRLFDADDLQQLRRATQEDPFLEGVDDSVSARFASLPRRPTSRAAIIMLNELAAAERGRIAGKLPARWADFFEYMCGEPPADFGSGQETNSVATIGSTELDMRA